MCMKHLSDVSDDIMLLGDRKLGPVTGTSDRLMASIKPLLNSQLVAEFNCVYKFLVMDELQAVHVYYLDLKHGVCVPFSLSSRTFAMMWSSRCSGCIMFAGKVKMQIDTYMNCRTMLRGRGKYVDDLPSGLGWFDDRRASKLVPRIPK